MTELNPIDNINGNNRSLDINVQLALLKYVKPTSAIVLGDITNRYKLAESRHRTHFQTYIDSKEEMAKRLNRSIAEIEEALAELEEIEFIKVMDSGLDGYIMIAVNTSWVDELIKDTNLESNQNSLCSTNPVKAKVKFCKSTKRIKKYIAKHFGPLTLVPLIFYSIIDYIIREYESEGRNIFLDFQMIKALDEYVIFYKDSDDYSLRFSLFINWLFKKVNKPTDKKSGGKND